ncbi:MAG TPA: hypothetical protein VGW12_11745 [Pyrinomonadaceae bacterium]|nr:hypothetical protein [Pyrinomonadaceae bacterium]
MRLACKTKFEKAWIVGSVLIIVTHALLTDARSGYAPSSAPLREWLELLMMALSFPLGGLTIFVLHDLTFWCDACRNLEFLLDWPTFLFAGYVQWFWMLPEFLRSRKLTFLDLKPPPQAATPKDFPVVSETTPAQLSTTPAQLSTTPAPLSNASPRPCAAPLPAFDAAAFAPMFVEFDEAGQTALDKVFQAPPRAPAQLSASPVETIFPRVS